MGREDEIRKLKRLLLEQKLVTILGHGGLGKSRLALQVAAEIADSYRDGVYWIPLASLHSPDFLASTIAESIHAPQGGSQDPQTKLVNYLQRKELLLVLDNFEHLREGAAALGEILDRASGVRMLVTSRERLDIPQETIFDLLGLPYPVADSVESVYLYSSVRLFVSRARRLLPEFDLSEADKPCVARICRLLEGMPLAIELAAAWVQAYRCSNIAAGIESSLAFLATDKPDVPERHRSLRAIFDSFWLMLSPYERNILCRLSLFHGGFTGDSALRVAGASPFFLDALVIKSFLRRSASGRYEIHELLRQYAADKFRAAPAGLAQVRDRHSRYFARFLHVRQNNLHKSKQDLEDIIGDLENIRSAWLWAVERGKLHTLTQALPALNTYYQIASRFQEGEKLMGAAIEALRLPGQTASPPESPHLRLLGMLLARRAGFQNDLARFDQAMASAKEAVYMAEKTGDDKTEASGLLEWGRALRRQGHHDLARPYIERALARSQASKWYVITVDCLNELGILNWYANDYPAARSAIEEAVRLSRAAGHQRGVSTSLGNLGIMARNRGHFDDARSAHEQALDVFREIGNKSGESTCLSNLGTICRSIGDFSKALDYFKQALKLYRETGARLGEGLVVNGVGLTYMDLGDFPKARLYFTQAVAIFQEIGDRRDEGIVLSNYGVLYHLMGENAIAVEYLKSGRDIAEAVGDRYNQAETLTFLAHALTGLGQFDVAVQVYEQAVQLHRAVSIQALQMEALAGQARLALALGDQSRAKTLIEEILELMGSNSLYGAMEPFRVYLTCYQILQAYQDERANAILKTARSLLKARAATIRDEALRYSYLELIPAHRELMRA